MSIRKLKRTMARILGPRSEKIADSVMTEIERAMRSRRDIDAGVIDAVLNVPRQDFVAARDRGQANIDRALSIGKGQTISQPSLVAHMISELRLTDEPARVLDVGCGSGYQAAVLSRLAEQVITVERIAELAERAEKRLELLGYKNIDVVLASDEALGYPLAAPYDAIIVGASAPKIPQSLVTQLKIGARLVIPIGPRRQQRLAIVTRTPDDYDIRYGVSCVFVPLIGPEAW